MAYYFIAKLDGATQTRMAGYYDVLRAEGLIGSQTKDIPYHFTLDDYDIAEADEAALAAQMEEICAGTSQFDLRMDHLGLFGLRVLFLEPNVNFELLQLRRSFSPGDCGGAHRWAAHATVLLDEDPDAILRAIPLLARRFEPFIARVESVMLWEFPQKRLIKECYLQ